MSPKKKGCCECCSKKKNKEKDCSGYPAGIQKEDLLWAYFVMRMVCDVIGEPQLMPKILGHEAPCWVTPFDIVIMCAAARNPKAYKKLCDEARKAEKKAKAAELKKKKADEEKRLAEEAKLEEEAKMRELAANLSTTAAV